MSDQNWGMSVIAVTMSGMCGAAVSFCRDAAPLDQRRSLLRPMSTAAAAAMRDTIARTCGPQPVDAAGACCRCLPRVDGVWSDRSRVGRWERSGESPCSIHSSRRSLASQDLSRSCWRVLRR